MSALPYYVSLVFALTALITALLFFKAAHFSKITIAVILTWLALQAGVGLSGFYTITDTLPPRFIFLVFPALLTIIILFSTGSGRKFIDGLDLETLTWLHTVRIPVEFVLFWLFVHKGVPVLMTFEGRNFDILSGITAPIVAFFGIREKRFGKNALLFWNFLCLGLLANIVTIAALSAQSPFQQLAFDQPNLVVQYFPFVWLPGFVVPVVLFSHLASIRQLMKNQHVLTTNKN